MIVADTNLAAYLIVQGTKTAEARKVWTIDPDWVLPPLWRSEFLNVLVLSVKNSVLKEEQATVAWHRASRLFGKSEQEPQGEEVLRASLKYGVSAYDAHFVVLAEKLGLKLVTGDRKLCRACPTIAVSIETFSKSDR
jgi:predicted nucleic acid-binding protein